MYSFLSNFNSATLFLDFVFLKNGKREHRHLFRKINVTEPEPYLNKKTTDCKHRTYVDFGAPQLSSQSVYPDVWVAPSASLVGRILIHASSSIWYNAVLRGDLNGIVIGVGTNVQDGVIMNESPRHLNVDHDGSVYIGSYVTIGIVCFVFFFRF